MNTCKTIYMYLLKELDISLYQKASGMVRDTYKKTIFNLKCKNIFFIVFLFFLHFMMDSIFFFFT